MLEAQLRQSHPTRTRRCRVGRAAGQVGMVKCSRLSFHNRIRHEHGDVEMKVLRVSLSWCNARGSASTIASDTNTEMSSWKSGGSGRNGEMLEAQLPQSHPTRTRRCRDERPEGQLVMVQCSRLSFDNRIRHEHGDVELEERRVR